MKTIKFRAWDVDRKKFQYFDLNQSWTPMIENAHNTLVIQGATFEQFTGLHDKNGKEIYEGDVIQNVADDGTRLSEFVIIWRESSCSFLKQRLDTGGVFGLEISRFYDVTRNIHENP